MLSASEIRAVASHLVEQRRRREDVSFPEGRVITDRQDIYRIQECVTETLGAGSAPAGFKVSWLPLQFVDDPADQCCFAGIPAGRVFQSGAIFKSSEHRRLGFEFEIACRFGVTRGGRAQPIATILGLEVIEEHHATPTRESIDALLASGMFNSGYVLGTEVDGWQDASQWNATVYRNGVSLVSTRIGEVFNPDERVQLFLAHAARFGWKIQDGMILSLAALNRDAWCNPGDEMTGEVEGIGRVSASIL